MKRFTIIVLAAIAFTNSFLTNGQSVGKTCNTKRYNYYINYAELAITDSLYAEALEYYDSAFRNIDSPFAIDKYNVAVCNALLGNFENCRSGVENLLRKGLERNLIRDNDAFSGFLSSEFGKGLFETKFEPCFDTNLRRIYDSIFEADQYYRKLHPRDYHQYYNDTVSKIDASNVKRMNDLIRAYGWPTENLIGIQDFPGKRYEIIIVHQTNPKYQSYNYKADIIYAYENCLIEANKAIYLLMRIDQVDPCRIMDAGLVTIIYDSLGIFRNDNLMSFLHKTGYEKMTDEQKTDQNRSDAGLESVGNYRKKMLFSIHDKRFIFKTFGNAVFVYSNKADYNYHANNIRIDI